MLLVLHHEVLAKVYERKVLMVEVLPKLVERWAKVYGRRALFGI